MQKHNSIWKITIVLTIIVCLVNVSCGNSDMIQDGVESAEDLREPEINVKQGPVDIPHETGNNGTGVNISNEGNVITIENLGMADLKLTGEDSIEVSGGNAADFSVEKPAETVILAGRNITFTITHVPLSTGIKTAFVIIENNDFDESQYVFTVTGNSEPEINIKQTNTDIPSGYGSFDISAGQADFTIENRGTFELILTGSPIVSISGEDSEDFKVLASPPFSIPSNENAGFTIIFDPVDEVTKWGDKSAVVTIEHNDFDDDENPYTFMIPRYPATPGTEDLLGIWSG